MATTRIWIGRTICLAASFAIVGICGGPESSSMAQAPAAAQPAPPVDQPPWLSINVSGHTAAVRALAFTPDAKRLCSAGLDKLVQVWNTSAIVRSVPAAAEFGGKGQRDIRRTLLLERSIRWQVARGLRGSIYSLAISPTDGLLAMGGYGAMGSLGEILLVDPVQGTLVKVLNVHRQTISSLAFSADGKWLASLDLAGQLVLWQRGEWQPTVIYETDDKVYGAQRAAAIALQDNLRPLTMVGSTHVLVPVYMGDGADRRAIWKLQQVALERAGNQRDVQTFDTPHTGRVSAVAVSADGSQVASADLAGRLYVGPRGGRAEALNPQGVVLSLAFDPRSTVVVAGTAAGGTTGKAQIQLWNLTTRTLRSSRVVEDNVSACVVGPAPADAATPYDPLLAYTGDGEHGIFLGKLSDLSATALLRATGRRVTKVAFERIERQAAADQQPNARRSYRIAFGTTAEQRAFNDYGKLEHIFDPVTLELGSAANVNAGDWLEVDASRGSWRAERTVDGALQLYLNNVAKGYVRFDPMLEGAPRCFCWLGTPGGEPAAIAVGTDVQNSIFVCQLVERGACPILRRFRAHYDTVTSLGVSRDLRYLVSGSTDGTVRVWSLSGLALGRSPLGRWGADLAVEQDGAQKRLAVTNTDPAGPFFFKGVRSGDTLVRIRWPSDAATSNVEEKPDAILNQLTAIPWGTQVVFEFTRNNAPLPKFQLLPAWQPMATLFVTADREWAFWTPEGYYDASINGHTLFGWQVNRGVDALPDFFRADQFRKKLERPDVLERLLPTGSLEEALRQAGLEPPKKSEDVLEQQIAAAPYIDIITPRSGTNVAQNTATVRVRVRVPAVSKLSQAKLFANGVVSVNQRLVGEFAGRDGKSLEYEWEAMLPSDEQRNLIQVFVNTDAEVSGFGNVIIERPDEVPVAADHPRKLHLLAVGVDNYADIPKLEYSVADARAVVDLLRERTAGLYHLDEPIVLVNEQVTRANWQQAFTQLSEKLRKDARPDDLLVIFMAGHGFVDEATQEYYYASQDLKFEDFNAGRFDSCISWRDFAALGNIPCRKLALLDTCHSGAVQALRDRGLKAAVRAFQEDVVFTVTASAGNERAAELEGHGVFTKSLLDVLGGRATTSGGVVMLNDVVNYVRRTVPELTEGQQNPTAAPEDLLPFVSMRLTSGERQARAAPVGSLRSSGLFRLVTPEYSSNVVAVDKTH